jgi:hypothetical protein
MVEAYSMRRMRVDKPSRDFVIPAKAGIQQLILEGSIGLRLAPD